MKKVCPQCGKEVELRRAQNSEEIQFTNHYRFVSLAEQNNYEKRVSLQLPRISEKICEGSEKVI